MSSDQTKSTLTARVETDKKADIIVLADDRSTPFDRVTPSEVVREAIDEYLEKHEDEIPEYDREAVKEAQMGAA